MRGHLYRRGETWTYVVDAGRDQTGRRRQRTKGGFRTRREAEAALHATLTAMQQGVYVEPARVNVGEFLLDTWLPAVKGALRPTTFSAYRTHVRCYLVPAFGDRRLQQLTPPMINAFYADLAAGWRGRRPLAPATIRRVHATLHRALRDAMRWQLVVRNAAGAADPHKAPRPRMTVWSPEQLQEFLRRTSGDRHRTLWLFYILTGVRRGEALALQVGRPRPRGGHRHHPPQPRPRRPPAGLRRAQDRQGPSPHQPRPRAPASPPGLPPGPGRGAHPRRRRLPRPGAGVLPPRRQPAPPRAGVTVVSALARASGVPAIRLHDLRHLHATLALSAGVAPRVLADRLGHSSTAMTTDIYHHVLPDLDRDAAGGVASIVFPGT